MDKQKNKAILSLPNKRSFKAIKEAVVFKKASLSPFHLYEILNSKTYHGVKYYAQVVAMPEPKQEEMTEKFVEESNQKVNEHKGKKKKWVSALFMLLNLGIVVGILLWNFLGTEEPLSFGDLLSSKINWLWVLFCVLLFFAVFIADSSGVYILVYYITKRSRPFLSYKSHAMCRFYDCATPLSTGGQPFQIYYLTKRGVSPGAATSVPIAKYLYAQFFNVIFIALVLILQHSFIITLSPFMLTLCYIGFAILLVIFGSIVFLSFSKKVAPACTIGVLKFLHKIKIVKDYRKSFVKVMRTVREYNVTMRQFISSGWIGLGMFISRLLTFIFSNSIPFFVYAAFMPLGPDWFNIYIQLFTIAVVTDLACSFMPLPGGTGMAEISFAVLFSAYFVVGESNSLVAWALLLWRILTFYGILLQGLIIMFYDYIIGNRKVKPLLERFEREDENKKLLENKKQPIKVVNNKTRKGERK